MDKKPNCYKCEYRGTIAGSAHSKCLHPAFKGLHENPLMGMAALFGGMLQMKSNKCKVEGHPQGIRGGWFGHPLNFDPTWLMSCTGYKTKGADNG